MSQKNFYSKEAKDKIKELAEDIDFAMMCTNLKNVPFHAIPMSTKEVDEQGNIWFLSNKESHHTQHILKDNQVAVLYSKPGKMTFLKVYGRGEVISNKNRIEELYGTTDDAWFEGVNDPNLCALKIKPEEAEYWEPKHNKLVSLFKMAVGALTDSEPDMGNTGSLNV
ncbi:pyridoxamine 5'-phosphate oxidase family protein [Confluentibacter sediminis]|uniref:pyridoxamine 5'-phosphate oxidase family protein n=1 Tax=Confluentibacter sediminis TaxID=2219045 RepID=UPI000DACD0F7|nr:pyridoxamine 5'-phosphate oxidase family protein [Confluentibacter sediminis]